MSLDAMSWAREITTGKASYKAVLIGLADFHHDKNNTCYPSIPALVAFTELNHKTIREALKWLENAGFITTEKRLGTSTNYHLNMSVTHSKIGTGSGSKNSGNLVAGAGSTHSKIGTGEIECTHSRIGRGTHSRIGSGQRQSTPSKNGHDPFQKRIEPLPALEHEQENRINRIIPLVAPVGIEAPQKRRVQKPEDERYIRVAREMWERIQPLTKQNTPPNFNTWAKDIRLLVETDKADPIEVWKVFLWANTDPFWQSNILSPGKLRKQFGALVAKRDRVSSPNGYPSESTRRTSLHHDLTDTSWANDAMPKCAGGLLE